MDDEKLLRELAEKVTSGKDEWISFNIDGRTVVTTTVFVRNYFENVEEWVRDYIKQEPKVNDFGRILMEEGGCWQKEFEGQTIIQTTMKDLQGHPTIAIETYDRLAEKGVLKTVVRDGQNRGSMKW